MTVPSGELDVAYCEIERQTKFIFSRFYEVKIKEARSPCYFGYKKSPEIATVCSHVIAHNIPTRDHSAYQRDLFWPYFRQDFELHMQTQHSKR